MAEPANEDHGPGYNDLGRQLVSSVFPSYYVIGFSLQSKAGDRGHQQPAQGHQGVPQKLKRTASGGSTHRTSQEHKDECEDLLPARQRTQIDCRETCHGCGANADEQCIRVGYIVFAVGSIEDGGENEGDEGTVWSQSRFLQNQTVDALGSQDEDVYPEKVEMAVDPSGGTIATFGYQVVQRRHNGLF